MHHYVTTRERSVCVSEAGATWIIYIHFTAGCKPVHTFAIQKYLHPYEMLFLLKPAA